MISLEELRQDAARMTWWQQHRFFALILAVNIISLLLVGVSLNLYNSSGAAQVDLSRPGYQSIQKEASSGEVSDSFASNGKLDAEAFDSFNKMYDNHARRVVGSGSFDAAALSVDSLQLFAP
jgi:hypothetical protein